MEKGIVRITIEGKKYLAYPDRIVLALAFIMSPDELQQFNVIKDHHGKSSIQMGDYCTIIYNKYLQYDKEQTFILPL